jgi:hypothetical protein
LDEILTQYDQHKSDNKSSPFLIIDEYHDRTKELLKKYQDTAAPALYEHMSELLYDKVLEGLPKEVIKQRDSDLLLLNLLSEEHELGFMAYNKASKVQGEITHLTKLC